MKTIDRYLIREILPPFFLALGIFTFVLAIRPMLERSGDLLAKGVDIQTVGLLLALLLPQALGVTIPMAFLAGLLMALGRLSGDREAVALLACGVSPMRLLRPVLTLAIVIAGLDLYVMLDGVPDANQRYVETAYRLLAQQTESDIKPGLFYERFPGKVLYVQAARPGGGWLGVQLADTSQPGQPVLTLAEEGRLELDEPNKRAFIHLYRTRQYMPGSDPKVYDASENEGPLTFTITAESIFGTPSLNRQVPEMRISDLKVLIAQQRRDGINPRVAVMYLHQKFSFPIACIVFALLGLAAGLHTRKEGKLAGMTLGIAIIAVYHVFMAGAESLTKGELLNAAWARWVPNLVLGPAGMLALWWRSRASGAELAVPMPQWLQRMLAASPPPDPKSAAATGAPRRVLVVIRIPKFALPRPRLLDLYVTGRYLRMAGLGFAALLVLYYIGTIVDLSDEVLKKQASAWTLGRYLWYSTPQFVAYVMPMAALVGVLGTIGGLTRSSELTVMRACGVSLYRVAVPLIGFSLVWSGALFLMQEYILGPANRETAVLFDDIHGRTPTVQIGDRNWLAGANGRIYYYAGFTRTPPPPALVALSVFDTATRPYRLTSHTYAQRALYRSGSWQAENGWIQRFKSLDKTSREEFSVRKLDLAPPTAFGAAQVEADLMTFGQLHEYIGRLGQSGFSVAEQRVKLQTKIAFPLVTLVMTLLGIPFGVTTGRRGALYGIGLAIVLAIMYWLLAYFFVATGAAGVLPPMLAAWATNILFLAAALYLTLTVRT